MKLEFSVYTDWDYFLRYRSDRLLCEAQNTKTRGHLGLLFNTLTVFHHVCNVFLLPRRGVSSGAVRLRSQYPAASTAAWTDTVFSSDSSVPSGCNYKLQMGITMVML
jgi:hypothetical protein